MVKLPRLNVGAGVVTPREEGKINCDLYPGPNIDVVFDATKTWPFADNSIGTIQSNHVLEHLADPLAFFKEAHRVLAPSGVANLYLRVPYGPSENGMGDVTHIKYFTCTSFACVQPDYRQHAHNPQYNDSSASFEVMQILRRVNPRLRWMVKPVIRRWGLEALDFLWGGYIEMIIALKAVKGTSPKLIANEVPVADVMYKHEYQNRPLRDGEVGEFIFFDHKEN